MKNFFKKIANYFSKDYDDYISNNQLDDDFEDENNEDPCDTSRFFNGKISTNPIKDVFDMKMMNMPDEMITMKTGFSEDMIHNLPPFTD